MTEDAPNAPCPIFFKTHCPNMKKGCQFHHQTEICAQGRACEVQDCQLRHPPQCLLYARGWCGFIDSQKIPRRYRSCSYFHNGNVPQIPPISTLSPQREGDINNDVTKQNTRREEGVENVLLVQPHPVTHLPTVQLSGDSNMNELKEELGQANARISKLEQSIKQLQDALEKQAKTEKEVAKKKQNNDTQLAHKVEENTREAYAIRQNLIQTMDMFGNLEIDVLKKITEIELKLS